MGQYYSQFEGPNANTGNAEKWFRSALNNVPNDLPTRQVVAVWALENGKLALCQGAGRGRPANRGCRCPPPAWREEVQRQHRGPCASRPGRLVGEGLARSGEGLPTGHLRVAQRFCRTQQHRPGPCRAGRPGEEAAGLGICGGQLARQQGQRRLFVQPWPGSASGATSSTRPNRPWSGASRRAAAARPIPTRPPTRPISSTTRARNGKPGRSWTAF